MYFVLGEVAGFTMFKNNSGSSTTPLSSLSAKVTTIFLLSMYPSKPI
jgi:hypothetical protein